ncbi:MAG TPA: TolC family protein [Longimicrobiales bacterium]
MTSTRTASIIRTTLDTARLVVLAILLLMLAVPLVAQEPAPPPAPVTAAQTNAQPQAVLTLEEAIRLARINNPTYRAVTNDATSADWAVREAYAGLLPSFGVNGNMNYYAAGEERVGNSGAIVSTNPASYTSSYSIGGSLQLSPNTFLDMSRARANRTATDARIAAAEYSLAADVTRQYVTALRTADEVKLREQELETAKTAERLAQARYDAGAAPRLDVAQAEVSSGRAEVALLQANSAARAQRRALLQLMGVDLDHDVQLTSTFTVAAPTWSLQELQAWATQSHPSITAARAQVSASKAASRAANLSYLPTFNLSGGVGGYTRAIADDDALLSMAESGVANARENCEANNELSARLTSPLPGYPQDCSRFVFTDSDRRDALAANSMFPFNFTKNPASFGLSMSFPIFNGFTRERNVQEARAAAQDASYAARAEELNRRAQVANAYDALQTAYSTVALEDRNTAAAAEQLRLAQERYSLGAGSIVELMLAQSTKAQADQARLAALYSFHENFAALENAVGRPLR